MLKWSQFKLVAQLFAIAVLWSSVAEARDSLIQQLELNIQQTNYLSEAIEETHKDQYSEFIVRYFSDYDTDGYHGQIDLKTLLSASEEDQTDFVLREAYFAKKLGDTDFRQLSFGRRRLKWSRFDEFWGLGIWQPNYRADYIRPESMGLSGIFLTSAQASWSWGLFYSRLFLPDQGASFDDSDGEITSSNRWFQAPVSEAALAQGTTDIEYEIEYPSVSKVINQDSFGFWNRFGNDKSGPWVQLSYAYKPVNQLHLGINTENAFNLSSSVTVARVQPFVLHHHVGTLETGYATEAYRAWVSYTRDVPNDSELPDLWEEAPIVDSDFYGAAFAHRLSAIGIKRTQVTWAYFKKVSGEAKNESGLVDNDVSSSLQRVPFDELAAVEIRSRLINKYRRKLYGSLKYQHAIVEDGGVLQAELNFKPKSNWSWYMGFDILGDGKSGEEPNGFFGRYRGNDRVYGGFGYVF